MPSGRRGLCGVSWGFLRGLRWLRRCVQGAEEPRYRAANGPKEAVAPNLSLQCFLENVLLSRADKELMVDDGVACLLFICDGRGLNPLLFM